MMVSHIVLRVREPNLARPVPDARRGRDHRHRARAGGGRRDRDVRRRRDGRRRSRPRIFLVALAYFWFYSRHHLVANAPEEEFAAIERGRGRARRGYLTWPATRQRSADTPTSSPIWRRCWPRRARRAPATSWPGVAAESAEERVAARMVLADVPLAAFLDEPLVPYEDDEVTRLIVDTPRRRGVRAGRAPDRRRLPRLAAVRRGRRPRRCSRAARRASRRRWRRRCRKLMRNQDLIAGRAQVPRRHPLPQHDRPAGPAVGAAAAEPPDRRPARHRRLASSTACSTAAATR